jgi:hypothetical protein
MNISIKGDIRSCKHRYGGLGFQATLFFRKETYFVVSQKTADCRPLNLGKTTIKVRLFGNHTQNLRIHAGDGLLYNSGRWTVPV